MTENERKEIKTLIEERLDNIVTEIEELLELTQPISLDNSIGRLSRMDAINNKAINEMQLREKRSQKKKLERALDRVEKPEFGKCSKCGNEIALGRLKYMPYTTKCVNCA